MVKETRRRDKRSKGVSRCVYTGVPCLYPRMWLQSRVNTLACTGKGSKGVGVREGVGGASIGATDLGAAAGARGSGSRVRE